jgi:predicted GNAT superfamily acetyltransferase
MLMAASHNGGLVIGAYDGGAPTENGPENDVEEPGFAELPSGATLVGFVFGFPGLYFTPDGPRAKHASHMLGVLPEYRDQGIGFLLKRAQWQMVRRQGLDRVTWTYDPLLSRNAYLNITRLGAVCSTYIRDVYGPMRDTLNAGLPTDRFQVDWWINSQRVNRRLSKRARLPLDLAHFLSAGTEIVNPSEIGEDSLARPEQHVNLDALPAAADESRLVMVEIPADFQAIRAADLELALEWRMHTRSIFERLFSSGYLVTDFVHLSGKYARSFYVLSHGESTL